MKKYSILIHHSQYEQFLKELQELGVLEVVDKGVEPDQATYEKISRLQQIDRIIKFLRSKVTETSETPPATLAVDDILDQITTRQSELDSLRQKIALLDKAYRQLLPWGKFSPDDIRLLEKHGFHLRFFEVSERKFQPKWLNDYYLEIISKSEGTVYFVIVQREGETIEIEAEEVKAPERPVTEIIAEKEKIKERIAEIEEFFRNNATAFLPVLQEARDLLEDQISFEKVISNTDKEASGYLMIIQGWVPEPITESVNQFLDQKEVFYLISEPAKDEKVPILLQNNSFSRLFEPIGKLYSLPRYGEIDLTPFFAPFFMLFFGFCLGDAGYGLIFLILAALFRNKVNTQLRPVLTLMLWLGSATVLFGIITGTFFGINLLELIDAGKLQWMKGIRAYMLDSEKLFNFALLLGGIQIVYGMVLKAANLIKQHGLPHALTTIGWVILIISSAILYLLKEQIGNDTFRTALGIVGGISGILILFFNSPGRNIFINLGGGIWEIYSIVTGLLGDLLSYIRLFALGVSSAILGYVFNDLALQMSGNIPVVSQIFMILILLIGHTLNIFMATLGAFVHPMRLTFVEFYKNAGFTGGGKAYNPFSKKKIIQTQINQTNKN